MKKKNNLWGRIWKGYLKAGIWLAVFISVQSAAGIGFFLWKIQTDPEFEEKVYRILSQTVLEGSKAMLKPALWNEWLMLFTEITPQILLVSGAVMSAGIFFFIYRKKGVMGSGKIKLPLLICSGILLNGILSAVIAVLPESLTGSHDTATAYVKTGAFILTLISAGFLSPFVEEMVFRYGMQRNLKKIHTTFAIIYQAAVFGLLHGNIVQSVYAFFLGLLFGYIYERTGDIRNSMVLHIAVNCSSVIDEKFFGGKVVPLFAMAAFLAMTLYMKESVFSYMRKVSIDKMIK